MKDIHIECTATKGSKNLIIQAYFEYYIQSTKNIN